MYSYGPPHMAVQKQDDQHEHTFSSCVRIRDVVLKTYLWRWTIGRSGERGSGISVLPARYDDDDDIGVGIYIYIYTNPSARTGCGTQGQYIKQFYKFEFRILLWPYFFLVNKRFCCTEMPHFWKQRIFFVCFLYNDKYRWEYFLK